MSADGKIIAIGSTEDTLAGRGPLFELGERRLAAAPSPSMIRRASGWKLRRYVKADTGQINHGFGAGVALNQNGNLLAVGAPTTTAVPCVWTAIARMRPRSIAARSGRTERLTSTARRRVARGGSALLLRGSEMRSWVMSDWSLRSSKQVVLRTQYPA